MGNIICVPGNDINQHASPRRKRIIPFLFVHRRSKPQPSPDEASLVSKPPTPVIAPHKYPLPPRLRVDVDPLRRPNRVHVHAPEPGIEVAAQPEEAGEEAGQEAVEEARAGPVSGRVAQSPAPPARDAGPGRVMAGPRSPTVIDLRPSSVEVGDAVDDIRDNTTAAILAILPNICPNYLREKCEQHNYDYQNTVASILDQSDGGQPYPQAAPLKRKRVSSGGPSDLPRRPVGPDVAEWRLDDDEIAEQEQSTIRKFSSEKRRQQVLVPEYVRLSKTLITNMFPALPVKAICAIHRDHGHHLLPTLLYIDSQIADKRPEQLPFGYKKRKSKTDDEYNFENLPGLILREQSEATKSALEEFHAAHLVCRLRKAKRELDRQRELEEKENFALSEREGTVKECECCYSDCAMNRMIHCNGEIVHWFCKDCSRRMAENQVGLSKYSLECMSTDGCTAGFTREQKSRFLSKKTSIALDRIEQEHILRVAGIENLETCPFCPFAAEYPPVEVNKEFRCENPECAETSCRLCRKATHIPKTCQEVERESGPSARLTIEEAMSAALIRNCNKCNTPFIKELGCNKMSCTRPGCHNVQCYVCHKSCDYAHFDDTTRGGKKGNCPLFENAEQRHADEVKAAEEAARQAIVAKNPNVDASFLSFKLSKKVVEDELKRKKHEIHQVERMHARH